VRRRQLASAATALALGVLALLLTPGLPLAAQPRPYDAPKVEDARAAPPLPSTYNVDPLEGDFVVAYHPSARERVRAVKAQLLSTRAALSAALGRDVLARAELRVAAVPDEMHTLGPTEDVPSYAPAIVFSRQRLVIASLASTRSLEPHDLGAILAHALAHLALDEALDQRPVPVWFHEGFAAQTAGDAASARAQALVLASMRRRLLPLDDLEANFPADAPETSLAYAEATDLVRFLSDKPRDAAFASLVERVRGGEGFDRALESTYETDRASLEVAWRKDLARRYAFLPVFLAGVLVWTLVAAVALVRRVRQVRRAPQPASFAARRATRVDPAAAVSSASSRLARATARAAAVRDARARAAGRIEGMSESMPADPDVPKVEHDGQWHTLH
jgi:hypothetical protein